MRAYDYDAVVYDGAVYCLDCLPVEVEHPDVRPIFATDEWEYRPCCDRCGREVECVTVIGEEQS